ncbi:uncharacterized protein RCC_04988 [Ramularia collo-cygni]|uniref:Uncharacterized protein n=1 Tax=Ramularia collo-cygni TaxID=112498 RepID=A0A2D3UQH5_9PEZI|nr:uncharacterized protein RCC_04988 [Ramularia collo-cygni]CZT19142.1 uncharacterized protein RCC_04988 [Ramularia collo-cygni]
MDPFEARRKKLAREKERRLAAVKETEEEEAALQREEQQHKETETLKRHHSKLQAELAEFEAKTQESQKQLEHELAEAKKKLESEHHSRIERIEESSAKVQSELLENVKISGTSSTQGSAQVDKGRKTASQEGEITSETRQHMVEEEDRDNIRVASTSASTKQVQHIPAAAMMVPPKTVSPTAAATTTTLTKKTTSAASRTQNPSGVGSGGKSNAPSSTKGKVVDSIAREITLKSCTMIVGYGEEWFELSCPVPECQQNANVTGYFNGRDGLKRHFGSMHRPRVFDLTECIVHQFDENDCKRLSKEQNPVTRRLPAKRTSPISGVPNKRSQKKAPGREASDQDADQVPETNVAKKSAAITVPEESEHSISEFAVSSTVLASPPPPAQRHGSMAPPKQSPKTPASGSASAKKQVSFQIQEDVIEPLTGGKEKNGVSRPPPDAANDTTPTRSPFSDQRTKYKPTPNPAYPGGSMKDPRFRDSEKRPTQDTPTKKTQHSPAGSSAQKNQPTQHSSPSASSFLGILDKITNQSSRNDTGYQSPTGNSQLRDAVHGECNYVLGPPTPSQRQHNVVTRHSQSGFEGIPTGPARDNRPNTSVTDQNRPNATYNAPPFDPPHARNRGGRDNRGGRGRANPRTSSHGFPRSNVSQNDDPRLAHTRDQEDQAGESESRARNSGLHPRRQRWG